MKIQTIFLLVVVFILLYVVVYYISKDASTLSSYIKSGTVQTTISPKSIVGENGASSLNYSYSVWFNVDDWNYRYGDIKVIFGRYYDTATGSSQTPTLPPAATTTPPPAATATPSTMASSSGGANSSNSVTTVPQLADFLNSIAGNSTTTSSSSDLIQVTSSNYVKYGPSPLVVLGPTRNNLYVCVQCSGVRIPYIMEITNVPIQRWVNLFVSVYGRTLDVYLDGKLVKTGIMPNIASVNPNSSIYLTPDGGFNGWTSKLQYWDTPSDPQKAWNTYKAGYGNTLFNSLLGKYQVQISVLKDNQPTTSVII